MVTVSQQDYLVTVYRLSKDSKEDEGAKPVDIAKRLNVSKASVTGMARCLCKKGKLHYERYSRIRLSAKGIKEARSIIRKHRIIEVFLTKKLGYDARKVHEEAHRLEHAFSDESIRRLSRMLDNPKKCPHGKRI